jgi:ribulose-5-phosphate 4-epimerase/fuculose-1-phosphate aldolase
VSGAVAEAREQTALGGRVLDQEGLSDYVWGHVSSRDPEGRGIWIKSGGLGFDEVTADNVQLVGWDGELLAGEGKRHIEYPIHTEALRARPDADAVVHVHPPHAIALMATGGELHAFSHTGGIFARPLPRYDGAVGLVTTEQEGSRLAEAIGDARGVLMTGHGVTTVGASVGVAVMTAIMLDRACRLQLLADAAGGVRAPYPRDLAVELYGHVQPDAHMLGAWHHLVRRVGARGESVPEAVHAKFATRERRMSDRS